MSDEIIEQKTVLQIVPSLQTGGAERTAVDISAALVDRGWRSIIASSGGRMVDEVTAQGGEHFTLPLSSKNPLTIWQNSRKLAAFIKQEKIDLIHARSRSPAWSSLWAARKTGIPFVTTYHGAYSQSNSVKAFYNSVMARADVVIANSNWTAELVRERNPWAADRVVPVYRGTDFVAFSKDGVSHKRLAHLRDVWGIEDDNLVVLHLGRLSSGKGQMTVIECAAMLRDTHPNLRFILAGDHQGREEYLASLKAAIAHHGLQNVVRLTGHCEDPAAAMALADVAVVASTYAETFGRAAVEASAFEKPLVVTNVGAVVETVLAPPDVAENARTGWKVVPGDARSMATAFDELLNLSADQRRKIGANARAHVVEHFSLERMCRETIYIYEKLLESS